MATVFSPPQHCSQPSTSYTTQIFSQSGLLPHSLNTSRQTGTLGREPPALFSSLFCSERLSCKSLLLTNCEALLFHHKTLKMYNLVPDRKKCSSFLKKIIPLFFTSGHARTLQLFLVNLHCGHVFRDWVRNFFFFFFLNHHSATLKGSKIM